jgi:UPF0755 protein
MTKNKVVFSFFLLLIVSSLWFYYQIYFPQSSFCDEETIFSVSRGENFIEISRKLKEEELIKNEFFFQVYAFLSGKFRNFQVGSYSLCLNRSVVDIVDTIHQGKTIQIKLTIIEGWNLKDVADYLEKLKVVNKDSFLKKTKNFKSDQSFSFLKDKPDEADLEGYLFPDTYFVPYGISEDSIIEIMLSNFDNKLSDNLKKELKNQEKTIFEAIIIASLIEKEVRTLEDKKLVSGIIQKRLKIGMPLQIDATISYITGKKTVRISISETQIDSPYNTYRYRGLPIGPICNPGLESIKAAIFPQESEYLFYLSKPDGETVFSKTLEEHNIAKNKYLK